MQKQPMQFRSLEWWVRWTKIAGGFSVLQSILQVLNAFTGFLLVRTMGKEDYAWFTIVNSLLATISILTDSGLGSAFSSLGGPICSDGPRFAALLAVTRRYRRLFMSLSLLVTLPAGAYALQLHEAPPWINALLLLVVVTSSVPAAEIAVLLAANRLHTCLKQILVADAVMNLTRLVLVSFGCYVGMSALLASGITAFSQWVQLSVLRRQTLIFTGVIFKSTSEFNTPMMSVVRHMLPICIFQCVQGNIITWILSIVGTTTNVADVGALSRLSMVMTFLFLPFSNIVFPMIARTTERNKMIRLCGLTVAISMVVAAILVTAGLFFWEPLLWLLGQQYSHLHTELSWYMGHVALGFLGHIFWGIVLTRSWVQHGWMHIPLTILFQILGAMWLEVSTATGAIQFAALSHLAGFVVTGVLMWRGVQSLKPSVTEP